MRHRKRCCIEQRHAAVLRHPQFTDRRQPERERVNLSGDQLGDFISCDGAGRRECRADFLPRIAHDFDCLGCRMGDNKLLKPLDARCPVGVSRRIIVENQDIRLELRDDLGQGGEALCVLAGPAGLLKPPIDRREWALEIRERDASRIRHDCEQQIAGKIDPLRRSGLRAFPVARANAAWSNCRFRSTTLDVSSLSSSSSA